MGFLVRHRSTGHVHPNVDQKVRISPGHRVPPEDTLCKAEKNQKIQ